MVEFHLGVTSYSGAVSRLKDGDTTLTWFWVSVVTLASLFGIIAGGWGRGWGRGGVLHQSQRIVPPRDTSGCALLIFKGDFGFSWLLSLGTSSFQPAGGGARYVFITFRFYRSWGGRGLGSILLFYFAQRTHGPVKCSLFKENCN